MIVNYIDIDFAASTIQEDFNEATRIAVLAAKSNPSVICKIRATMVDEDDKVELHESAEKAMKDNISQDIKDGDDEDKWEINGNTAKYVNDFSNEYKAYKIKAL